MFPRSAKSALILVLVSASSMLAGDIKVKTTQQASATTILLGNQGPSEWTIYVHDMVQRLEFAGSAASSGGPLKQQTRHLAIINHCDTGLVHLLDLDRHEYVESKMDKFPSEDEFAKQMAQAQKEDQKYMGSSTADSGETKDFHGHVAKHLVTTIKAKDKHSDYEGVVDGWYLDYPQPGCSPQYLRQRQGHLETGASWTTITPSPIDRSTSIGPMPVPIHTGIQAGFVYEWFLPAGLIVQQTSTSHSTLAMNGRKRTNEVRREQKIVEFSETPLDPALFEVPPGFKKVRDLYHK